MNKICGWIRATRKLIIVILVLFLFWLLLCFIICQQEEIQDGDKIQACTILALIFITGIYAFQTYNIVREEKKRREAEFGHTRIKDFYLPMLEKLQNLEKSLDKMQFDMSNANEIIDIDKIFKTFDSFRYDNSYLATSTLAQELLQFSNQIKERWIAGPTIRDRGARENWRDDFLKKTRQAILAGNKEFRDIMIQLRKTYGYFSEEEEKTKKEVNHETLSKEKRKMGGKMNKKRKVGILLILIGIGIPLVLLFFQEDGEIRLGREVVKEVERNLTPEEIEFIKKQKELIESEKAKLPKIPEGYELVGYERWKLAQIEAIIKDEDFLKKEKWTVRTEGKRLMPYKYTVGIGIVFILVGVGFFIFSFLSLEQKKK